MRAQIALAAVVTHQHFAVASSQDERSAESSRSPPTMRTSNFTEAAFVKWHIDALHCLAPIAAVQAFSVTEKNQAASLMIYKARRLEEDRVRLLGPDAEFGGSRNIQPSACVARSHCTQQFRVFKVRSDTQVISLSAGRTCWPNASMKLSCRRPT
jgi:hypothetical protein